MTPVHLLNHVIFILLGAAAVCSSGERNVSTSPILDSTVALNSERLDTFGTASTDTQPSTDNVRGIDEPVHRGRNLTESTPGTKEIKCVCKSRFPTDCNYKSVCTARHSCYSVKRLEGGKTVVAKGCLDLEGPTMLTCNLAADDTLHVKCCDTSFCNRDMDPELQTDKNEKEQYHSNYLAIILVPIAMLVIIACFFWWFCWRKHQKRMQELEGPKESRHFEGGLHVEAVGESTLRDMMTSPCSSGSGSGLPLLVHSTVARQIALVECIGKGRYGEVWRGIWQGESVAVKIFSSRDEQSFDRETEIYNTVMLRHQNVLGYIASDMTSRHSCTQLWLICYYHPLGSLYEYLQRTKLDTKLVLQLCLTAANGLTHLHTDITGVKGKPAIAHRDIKSKNILVKDNLTCCIADLGLAVLHKGNAVDIRKNDNRVGTKRYMAPEVLDETINVLNFDSFKQADVYAFGLVLWEIARRCLTKGIAEEYKPPFYDVVGHDPSFEEMRKIVCDDEYRPVISNRWHSDDTMSILAKLMKEMWTKNASSRLTMLRVKKTLQKAVDQIPSNDDLLRTNYDDSDLLIPRGDKAHDSAYSSNLLKSLDDSR